MDLAASPNRDLMLHGASTAHPYFSSLLEGKWKLLGIAVYKPSYWGKESQKRSGKEILPCYWKMHSFPN